MKKILMAVVAAAGALMLSAEMPRSEWHAKVGDCALDPAALKSTISQLSSADKTAFLAEVNEAIGKMPGSAEAKAANYLAANRAAVAGAGAADRAAVLAEVYATVPPEALTVINEEFAKSEFSRPATMTDEEYTNVVAQTMAKITQRCSSSESGGVRAAFAGLMFVRAAGSAQDATTSVVVDSLPSDVQSDASSSWFPSALGQNQSPSYDPMLGPAQAGDEPDHGAVIAISGPQIVDSMLADLQGDPTQPGMGNTSTAISPGGNNGAGGGDSSGDGFGRVPRDRIANETIPLSSLTGNPADSRTYVDNPYYTGKRRGGGGGSSGSGTSGGVVPTPEPVPYWMQGL